jgi:hypothetical protein
VGFKGLKEIADNPKSSHGNGYADYPVTVVSLARLRSRAY